MRVSLSLLCTHTHEKPLPIHAVDPDTTSAGDVWWPERRRTARKEPALWSMWRAGAALSALRPALHLPLFSPSLFSLAPVPTQAVTTYAQGSISAGTHRWLRLPTVAGARSQGRITREIGGRTPRHEALRHGALLSPPSLGGVRFAGSLALLVALGPWLWLRIIAFVSCHFPFLARSNQL